MKIRLSSFQPLVAVCAGLALGLLVVSLAGESPIKILGVLFKSSFASRYDLGMTLFYATPLILCGLSVSVAFRAGLFNIGAEGQLVMGALGAACCGIFLPALPFPISSLLAVSAAFAMGALWGGIAGLLRVARGSHEVITTIMLNFIAAALTSWFILYPLKNPDSQNPETMTVAKSYLLAPFSFFQSAPVGSGSLLALLMALILAWAYRNTKLGFEFKCVGQSEDASRAAGINVSRTRIFAFLLAGGLAGLVGAIEVLGNSGKFKMDFSPGFGFTGIAVALLARGNPIGVLFSGLLFGALHKGSLDLDLETEKITREVSMVLQGLVILTVAADGLWDWMKRDERRKVSHG